MFLGCTIPCKQYHISVFPYDTKCTIILLNNGYEFYCALLLYNDVLKHIRTPV